MHIISCLRPQLVCSNQYCIIILKDLWCYFNYPLFFVPSIAVLLNLLLVATGAVPRGGMIAVSLQGEGPALSFVLRCSGPKARVPSEFLEMLNGQLEGEMSAHAVQPYYTILLAKECGLSLSARAEGEDVVLEAS